MIGAFQGWGGIIYMLAHLSKLWGDAAFIAEAEEIVKTLPPLIEQDEHNDIISGAAGCLASLLCLHACSPAQGTLAAARLCGARLLERARPMERGLGWFISKPQTLAVRRLGWSELAQALVFGALVIASFSV